VWGVCVREVCVVVLEQILQLYPVERQSKKKYVFEIMLSIFVNVHLQVFLVTTTRRCFVIVMYLGDQDHHNLSLICLTSKHVGVGVGGYFF